MAAVDTVYINNAQEPSRLHVKKAGEWEVSIPYALPLIGYGSTDSDILQKFYLDKLLPVKINNSGTEVKGFIGCVYEGSANYNMHNPARLVDLQLDELVGGIRKRLFALNDAGLNTYGDVFIGTINPQKTGQIKIPGTYYSSYWNDTASYGILIDGTDQFEIGTFIAKNSYLSTSDIVLEDLTLGIGEYTIRGYITNEEGTYYGYQNTLTVQPSYYLIGREVIENGAGTFKLRITIEADGVEVIPLGVDLTITLRVWITFEGQQSYDDRQFTIPAGISLYDYIIDVDADYDTDFHDIDRWGIISYSPTTYLDAPILLEPPTVYPPSVTINYTGYDETLFTNACSVNNPKTLYLNEDISTYFKNPELTEIADNGYYVKDNTWYLIFNGILEEIDGCPE